MNCPECGKRIYIDASNCFYCGAVLGRSGSTEEVEAKSERVIKAPSSVFDKQGKGKAQPYSTQQSGPPWTNGSQNAASTPPPMLNTNHQSPSEGQLPSLAPPPSIDSYYTHKGNLYREKPPLLQNPQASYIPPYTPFVKNNEKEYAAKSEEYLLIVEKKKSKRTAIIVIAAVVAVGIILGVGYNIFKNKKETEDSAIAYYKMTDLLKIEMAKENWLFDAQVNKGERADVIYADITNRTGNSYKNVTFHFSVQDKDSNLIGSGKFWYEFFEKDTTDRMTISVSFFEDNNYDRYIAPGDSMKLVAIIGESYNFKEDAPGIVLYAEPDVQPDGYRRDEHLVNYKISATNNNPKPTAAMAVIIPIKYKDYWGGLVQKEIIRIIIPPLEPDENYSKILEDVFAIHTGSQIDLYDYLKENEYTIGEPVVYSVKECETHYLMKAPYILANLTPFIDERYSRVQTTFSGITEQKEFYLDVKNLWSCPLYNVSLEVSFYYQNFAKIETVTINIGDLQVNSDYGYFGSYKNAYALSALLEDSAESNDAVYYSIDEIYGYYLEEQADSEDL